jgi:hypothetical protein
LHAALTQCADSPKSPVRAASAAKHPASAKHQTASAPLRRAVHKRKRITHAERPMRVAKLSSKSRRRAAQKKPAQGGLNFYCMEFRDSNRLADHARFM